MSVDRDTLARVHGIPAEQVKCANCARHSEFINKMVWCDEWNDSARADEFCSFYERESDDANTSNALNALKQENREEANG